MRTLFLRVCIPAMAFAGLVASASGASFQVPDEAPIASIIVPDDWKPRSTDEYVEATSPEDRFHILVIPAERNKISESMGEVMRHIRGQSGITVNPKSLSQTPAKINEMEAKIVSWEGKDQKGKVKISFTILFMTPGKSPLLFAAWGSPEAESKNQTALQKMLASIKRK